MIFIYRFLTIFFYPIFIILIYSRKLLNKEDNYRYKEKIFPSYFSPNKDNKKQLIWFHAASIGEVQSIFPLIQKLNDDKKNIEFLITTVTLSAGNILKKKLNNYKNIEHRYFPLDVNFLIKSFLDKWKPNLIIFVDSEIWPNLIFEIKKRKIPVALINGRITKKTFNKWMLVSKFARKIFNNFDLCLASSKESEENLRKLNVKNLKYIGNIKFSGEIEKNDLIDKNLEILKNKTFWCAASTHKGEEIICLKTHLNLKKFYKDIVTIIIPRHINRSIEINQLCKKYELSSQILNDKELIEDKNEIIIINSFGTLSKFYNYSKSVFIGKSMIKKLQKVGGQNPIEAAKLGCKIYHGPYVYNFKEIYDLLRSYKISEKIYSDKELSEKLMSDLKNSKNDQNEITNSINDLGKKILNNTTKEINKFLI
jgi:3-deoxy-D-manno-octulosonic-acid transferase